MWEQSEVTASTSVPASRIRQFRGFGDDEEGQEEEFALSFDTIPNIPPWGSV